MNDLDIANYIKIGITIISLLFAFWQYSQKRKIKKLIALEAVELHKNIAVVLGATQAARKAIDSGISPVSEIGRAEGLSQAILLESAKLYCNLKNTRISDIDDMVSRDQLNDQYKQIYYSFSLPNVGWIRKQFKKISMVI